jgi:hypothetical protein
LKGDTAFGTRVNELGEIYLADGAQLVHGDFFPGSWLRTPHGPMIIDPEPDAETAQAAHGKQCTHESRMLAELSVSVITIRAERVPALDLALHD